MKETLLKNGLSIRGDSLYCPLSFALDTYGNCMTYCHHCYFRRLNRTWGKELKPLDIDLFQKKIENGLRNNTPKSPLSHAIRNKNTLRVGNKTDPYQDVDRQFKTTRRALKVLLHYKWDVVIQTKFTENVKRDEDLLIKMNATIMPIVSPGLNKDWELLERKKTTLPEDRIDYVRRLQLFFDLNVGVNGEPFIPGFHTEEDFEETIKLLKDNGIKSYNTYNLHLNDLVAKNLHAIGLDIEKIWFMNQDAQWKKILPRLIGIAKKHNIRLGCPDFVNSGNYREKSNTCCGIQVKNPTTFNAITWKRELQKGKEPEEVFEDSWDGVGDYEQGKKLFDGKLPGYYSLKDIEDKKGLFK